MSALKGDIISSWQEDMMEMGPGPRKYGPHAFTGNVFLKQVWQCVRKTGLFEDVWRLPPSSKQLELRGLLTLSFSHSSQTSLWFSLLPRIQVSAKTRVIKGLAIKGLLPLLGPSWLLPENQVFSFRQTGSSLWQEAWPLTAPFLTSQLRERTSQMILVGLA